MVAHRRRRTPRRKAPRAACACAASCIRSRRESGPNVSGAGKSASRATPRMRSRVSARWRSGPSEALDAEKSASHAMQYITMR
ncbi:hypothetical protein A176_000597 [Myxococcus hansupus]|uniref:Uncharacterized protein n=1 Tax=Pseudomyxococcus hansupus TaxID=1297742 RepID=A0A0H4WQR5_9BACT|nr:hypothetical protein A176_000597 [Myxococcus hansupus]